MRIHTVCSWILLFFFGAQILQAQSGHHIELTIGNVKDTTGLLAFHYGSQKMIEDTLYFDANGKAVVKGPDTLPHGIYLMVSPAKDYFEFIVSEDQHFSISATGPDYVKTMEISGSKENEIFLKDLRFIVDQRQQYEANKKRLEALKGTGSDSVAILEASMQQIDQRVRDHRKKLIKEHPDLFYSAFLAAMQEPEIKEPINPVTGEVDSAYPYRYYKAHFWDHVDFSEGGLLRTPILQQKIKTYINQLTPKHPDSVIASAEILLQKAKAHKEIFKYTLAWLLNKYAKREMMGFDKVYVHLAEKYYLSGQADWVDEDQLRQIREDTRKMKPLLLGEIAPNITAKTADGKTLSLYDMKDFEYLILWIWDADCGHCRKETPKLHKKYQEWKDKYNLKVYAISTELTRDRWDKFIADHQLDDWVNVIDVEGQDDFREEYDVRGTPTVFILDENFKIIGKRLSVDQMEGFFEFEEKKQQP